MRMMQSLASSLMSGLNYLSLIAFRFQNNTCAVHY